MIENNLLEIPEKIKYITKEIVMGILKQKGGSFSASSIGINQINQTNINQTKPVETVKVNEKQKKNSVNLNTMDLNGIKAHSYMSVNVSFSSLFTELNLNLENKDYGTKLIEFLNKAANSKLDKLNDLIKKSNLNFIVSKENIQ